MINQEFTEKNLRYLLTTDVLIKHSIKADDAKKVIKERIKDVSEKGFYPKSIVHNVKNDKTVYKVDKDIFDYLLLKKINDNLKRLYKVKQANRNTIIKQVIQLVHDCKSIPVYVHKYDIKSFYESIDKSKLLQKLNQDGLLARSSYRILSNFFDSEVLKNTDGVPRGLSISSTLSEIYLRKFDRKIKKIEGVYFYSRFVDDIIIFTFKEKPDLKEIIIDELSSVGLKLSDKSEKIVNNLYLGKCKCSSNNKCSCDGVTKSFSYLGYNFICETEKFIPDYSTEISKNKIKKYKTRIIKAFLAFQKEGSIKHLEERIKYLTANYPLYKYGRNEKEKLRGGIFYHYMHLSSEEPESLKELDRFLKNTISSGNCSFGRRNALNRENKKRLFKHSFLNGYRNRITNDFSKDEIKKIKECW